MRSVELNELPVPVLQTILQSPGEPVEVRIRGRRVGTLTFEAADDEPPADASPSPRLKQMVDEAREDYRKHGGVSLQEIKDRLAADSPAQD